MPKLFIPTLDAIVTIDDDDLMIISDEDESTSTKTKKVTISALKNKFTSDLTASLNALEARVTALE